jgi:hypothetical protein
MSLAEELDKERQDQRGRKCAVCDWLARQSQDDRDSFDEWVDQEGNFSKLWRACRRRPDPLPCQYAHLTRHIRGGCGRLDDVSS